MASVKEELLAFIKTTENVAIEFLKKAKEYHGDIYLYGAGHHLPFVVGFMQKYDVPIKGILDSNKPSSHRRSDKNAYDGDIPIINFDDFLSGMDVLRDCWFVIAAPSVEEDIRKNIAEHFPQGRISSFEVELYVDYFSLQDIEAYRAYIVENWDAFMELHDTLADDKSRETLVSVLKGRLSGRLEYFRKCFVPDQYYPSDVIAFSRGEVMVELGAYDGQTMLQFIRRCPDYQEVYCFEPDTNLLPGLRDIQKQLEAQGKPIHIIPKGAWDCGTTLEFSVVGSETGGTHVVNNSDAEQTYTIETATVDDAVQEPISYMKMDIEGSELRALHGAEKHIINDHPKLAVCVYHKNEDFLDIWKYLRNLVPEYRFYLRHHTVAGAETVLYAIPE